jgi:copper homeostasis protein
VAGINQNKVAAQPTLLEVIACSVADATAAAGADRLELISHFEVGGLTPSLEMVREVIAAVRIPVRVMLRESENFQVDDETERSRLCELAAAFNALPVDGLVCGFLKDGGIDHELLARVLSCAPKLKATFHRAIEELRDPLAAISELKKHPQVDRILTSGGPGDREQKIACLNLCQQAAQPEITILAGGGMTADLIRELRNKTAIREYHVGTFVRVPVAFDGAVSAEKVISVRKSLSQ